MTKEYSSTTNRLHQQPVSGEEPDEGRFFDYEDAFSVFSSDKSPGLIRPSGIQVQD
jgi:hypothetical protein